MISIENISDNIIKIKAPAKIKDGDFQEIAPIVENLISKYSKVKLFVDASLFNGWENVSAFERHIKFVKRYHRKVDRIAIITAHPWQNWIVSIARMLVHPEIKVFNGKQEKEAGEWVSS